MNTNYKKLVDYFKSKNALTDMSAITLEDGIVENISEEELKKMLNLMGEFHITNDNKWFYKPESLSYNLLTKTVIGVIIGTIIGAILF